MNEPLDPLAAMHSRLHEVYESATPPDARGAAEEVTDLEGLRRSHVTVRQDDHNPKVSPSIRVDGGDHRDGRSDVRKVGP